MDLVHALGIDDQQHADAPLFAVGKWTAEEDEASLSQLLHERRVVVYLRLLEDRRRRPRRARLHG